MSSKIVQRYGYGGWVQLHHHCKGKARMLRDGKLFRVIEDNCWSPEARVADMDKTGLFVCMFIIKLFYQNVLIIILLLLLCVC